MRTNFISFFMCRLFKFRTKFGKIKPFLKKRDVALEKRTKKKSKKSAESARDKLFFCFTLSIFILSFS